MKPGKRPASKIPRVRKKKAVPVFTVTSATTHGVKVGDKISIQGLQKAAQKILRSEDCFTDKEYRLYMLKEINHIKHLKTKYLLIGILIGIGIGYGLHSALTWI